MKIGTRVRVTRFNGSKASGKIAGKPRVGLRGAWIPVELDSGITILCRQAQLAVL